MIIKSSLKMGSSTYQFEFDEKDELDTLHKSIVLSNPLKTCDACREFGYETKYFTSNKDQEGNTYVNVKCKCGASSKLGRYKTGGYFWHKYEVYVRPTETKSDLLS